MRNLHTFRRLRSVITLAACLFAATPAVVVASETPASAPAPTVLAMPLDFVHKTSGFAMRRHPIRKTVHFHAGVDFAAPHGTPVRSVDAGWVEFAGTQGGYGKVVHIRHGSGHRTTVYAHLSRIEVRTGEQVEAGQKIGAVGSTGLSTGPHLHFEVREGGRPIDPMLLAYASAMDPVRARPSNTAIPGDVRSTLVAPTDPARCLELLQKFSLDTLAPDELDQLRNGCLQ